jgi:membrane protein implicated in regulation of membrane protease activity
MALSWALSWWLWLLLGFLLFALELATPGGFFVFFFGVGAVVVALLSAVGIAGPPWVQWMLFGAISAASLLLFRQPLQHRIRRSPSHEVDSLVGETAVSMDPIGVRQMGRVELRGTVWSARNTGEAAIAAGQRCSVEKVDGLTLNIRG